MKYRIKEKSVRENKIKKYNDIMRRHKSVLTDQDFYFNSDDRVWTSNVDDIENGDNFTDYCEEFFELLDEEGYYDN